MTSSVFSTEGSLAIHLGLDAGHVAEVDIRSTRPLGVTRIFLGKPIGEVLGTLPLLFSICATAQTAAAVAAAEAALGTCPSEPQRRARGALVLAETAREHLVRCLLGWGAWLGERPDSRALAMAGRLQRELASALYPEGGGFQPGGGRLSPDRARLAETVAALERVLAECVLGTSPKRWMDIDDAAGLAAWSTQGHGLGARALARIAALGWSDLAASTVPVLEETNAADLEPRLAGPEADAFIACPTWNGQPRETGALAREHRRPLVADLVRRHGNGLLARLAARLSELVGLPGRIRAALDGLGPDLGHPISLPAGTRRGIGQVEAARGRLIHRVEIEAGQVAGYRILAPTEWNFHPNGVLARGLHGLPAGPDLKALVSLIVEAVDPCVGYRIETTP